MKFWNQYKSVIWRNLNLGDLSIQGLVFWQNQLFYITLLYLIPFSFLVFIPGFYVAYLEERWFLIISDLIALGILAVVAFTPWPSVKMKKMTFVALIYFLAMVMMIELGLLGPGLMYLVGGAVFTALLLPRPFWRLSVFGSVLVCLLYYFAQDATWASIPDDQTVGFLHFLAVIINVFFVNAIISILLPLLLKKMEDNLLLQRELMEQLELSNERLDSSLKKLEFYNLSIGQLVKVTSQELQEPLRMISAFLKRIKDKYHDRLDEKGLSFIDFAMKGEKDVRDIVMRLWEFSVAEKTEWKVEPIDLNGLIDEILLSYRREIETYPVKIEKEELPQVWTDKEMITAIFTNLLMNAVQFSKPQSENLVQVKFEEKKEYLIFEFVDHGIGIEREQLENIFLAYRKVPIQNYKRKRIGLGLPIVKRAVEALQGEVWVESTFGTGTTVFVSLPKKLKENPAISQFTSA
ncbi:Histidine kinase-, DNA gyrase B-, and HSP90-like ATPase [Algoriphagus faecimaris]|uniref:histidine kinase n=1 Tax=Algoriphagus faecimaris TaxID=686796 RepID=A0A1G6SPI7_9BACT|nr:ATP-binding protein [Algoriphagus faecimaris]SDD18733.1 Histidine kinase-, DNA gyrase B-, and HSP90-like ATPase [Algoriphagus faecimaris]